MTAPSRPRLESRLATLARFGALPDGGVTRPAWSQPHEEARRWLLGEMASAGLATWVDAAGNVFGALRADRFSADRPLVLTGSHIDTVPEGGIYDGALGVLAGLECLQAIRESGTPHGRPLAVAAWSDEEGRYASLFGSRAFCGLLEAARIPDMAAVDGERLVDAMARAGFDPARAPLARAPRGSVSAYVELHIEQGPVLEEAGVPLGIVEAIVGLRRYRLVFRGQADHAGTTPMERRRDAFLAAADYALRAREIVMDAGSGRSVTNFGLISLHPGASNIVPGRAELVQEIRDPDPDVLGALERRLRALAGEVAGYRGVEVEMSRTSETTPARCSPRVAALIERAAADLGLASRRMHSGAGHDAQNLAAVTEAGMIFIPSKGGRSHRVDEASDGEAIERGARVLLRTLLALTDSAP